MSLPDRTSLPNNSATDAGTGQPIVRSSKDHLEAPEKDVDSTTDAEIDSLASAGPPEAGIFKEQLGGDSPNIAVTCGKEMIEQPAGHQPDLIDQPAAEPSPGVIELSSTEDVQTFTTSSNAAHEAQAKYEESLLDQPVPEEELPTSKPLPAPPSEAASLQLSAVHGTWSKEIGEHEPVETLRTETRNQDDAEDPGKSREDEAKDSESEIQNIMDQFDEDEDGGGDTGTPSPGGHSRSRLLEKPIQHPPRTSSLEPPHSVSPQSHSDDLIESPTATSSSETGTPQRPIPARNDSLHKASSIRSLSYSQSGRYEVANSNDPTMPMSPKILNKTLPPAPDPEPDLPFDFHRFLEQLRHRTADPVAKFLRSFLVEFGKKQWMVHEQVKIISDFLSFITGKMAQCEVWREVSDAEFDNAKEGMEKLVMNRLYSQTFSPAIPAPVLVPAPKGKRKAVEKPLGPGRRGQHQEDIERDEILAQKVRIYGWVQEEHLDIPAVGESGKRFLLLAQQGTIVFRRSSS